MPVFNPKFSNIYNSWSLLLLFLLWMAQKWTKIYIALVQPLFGEVLVAIAVVVC